ncbi:MAG: diguanylate cyclase [Spirochaetes bacterium]|nr:diguanylate cyclase [Spirochaetota bacterium]
MERRFLDFFYLYLETYLKKRDLPGTLALISEDMRGFGTGMDEKIFSAELIQTLYERDLKQAPSEFRYAIKDLRYTQCCPCTAVIHAELDVETQILEQNIKLHNIRLTTVLTMKDQGIRLQGMHISFPTSVHGENEAYPLKELEEISAVINRLVQEKTSTLQEAYAELQSLVATDKLTQIYNRMKLDEVLDTELRRFTRYGTLFSIILFDIDRFKQINDQYGHLIGDKVLMETAKILTKQTRNTDACGRWGGEEFVVILPETSTLEANAIGERIRKTIEGHTVSGVPQFTISAGVTQVLANDTKVSIMERADKALYMSKNSGRNKVSVL